MRTRTTKVSWDQVEEAADVIAIKIHNDLHNNYDNIYAIPRGGLVLGVMLSHRLSIPMVSKPTKNSLIVDDIADTGETLQAYPKHGHAVVVWKDSSKVQPLYFGSFTRTKNWIKFPWEI